MSLYATIDDIPAGDVATNSGWGDFRRFVEMIPDVAALRHLTEYGWIDEAANLVANLQVAIASTDDPDRLNIGSNLLRMASHMREGDVLTISDGTGVVEDDDSDMPHPTKVAAIGAALESVETTEEARQILESLQEDYP